MIGSKKSENSSRKLMIVTGLVFKVSWTKKQLKVSAYLCKIGLETIARKESKVTSINSAAIYHENQCFQKDH